MKNLYHFKIETHSLFDIDFHFENRNYHSLFRKYDIFIDFDFFY